MNGKRSRADIDWGASPTIIVASIRAKARILQTPCLNGTVLWHQWPGPSIHPPLVLIHGGWGSWTHWIKSIIALSKTRTVYAVDIPGMGGSGDVGQPVIVTPIADVITQGIDQLIPNTTYDLAGFSFGGIVAAHVAVRHRTRCRSFTAVGAAGFGEIHFVVEGIKLPDIELSNEDKNSIHRENLKLLMLANDDNIDPLAIHIHRTNIEQGRMRSRRISLTTSLIEALPKIKSRIGGIWGERDTTGNGIAMIEKRRDIFRDIQPDCPFDIIPNGGHWVMYEEPKKFVETLLKHLAVHAE